MRVQSVYEVNTNYQQNPHVSQNDGYASTGKGSTLTSFNDCLREQIQKMSTPAKSRKTERQADSAQGRRYLLRGLSISPELIITARAYQSRSELIVS